MSSVGNRLKELRESLGYGPDEFAALIGIHRSSIYRYEGTNDKEKRDLPMSLALTISEKFNVSLDWLAGTSTVKFRNQTPTKLTEVYESLSEKSKEELFNYAMFLKSKEMNK